MCSLMLSELLHRDYKTTAGLYSRLTCLFPLKVGHHFVNVSFLFFFYLKDFTETGLTTQSLILINA